MYIEIEKLTSLQNAKEVINFSKKGFESKLKSLSKLYASEHSPMYSQVYIIRLFDIPYHVHVHILTHKNNFILHCTTTNRPDKTFKERSANDTVNMIIYCNAKKIVDMMLKRLCFNATSETTQVLNLIKQKLEYDKDELAMFCVSKCVYRNGLCGEFESCGFNKTEKYKSIQLEYNKHFKL